MRMKDAEIALRRSSAPSPGEPARFATSRRTKGRAYCAVALLASLTWPGTPSVVASQGAAEWPTPANLIDDVCVDAEDYSCDGKAIRHRITIRWDDANVRPRMIVPDARVRFGPFFLSKQVERRSGDTAVAVRFTVSVWARSPALYDASGQYLGAQPGLRQIGSASRELSGDDVEEDALYVTATLPGVFTAVQLRAAVSAAAGARTSSFPAACGDLPASATAPAALDQPCLQVAVNPLAVLVPKVFPLAILYEPPGNCSWANLTSTHAAGSAVSVEEATSASTHTITDTTAVVQIDHSDFTEEKTSASERQSQLTVSRAQSYGTQLGLPLESPGNPQCNNPDVTVPDRPNSGPGRGDVFVLLYEPSLVHWNTQNMSNFLFSDQSAPDHPRRVFVATARQIATGEGLPPAVSLTAEERQAILGLDPFTSPAWSTAELPERLIFLDEVWDVSKGLAVEQNQDQRQVTVGRIREALAHAETTTEDGVDFATKLVLFGLNMGGSAAVEAGIGQALIWMATQWPNPWAAGFGDLGNTIDGISVPHLFGLQNQTTLTTTYTRSRSIEKTEEDAITQSFHIKDTNQGMSVALFYDALFGTFAFVPWPEGMGVAREYGVRRLPSLVWSIATRRTGTLVERMPDELRAGLARAGAVRGISAPSGTYGVAGGLAEGLPLGFRLDLGNGTLSGRIPARMRSARALYVVLDGGGRRVAQLWVTIHRRGR